jgi:hypothetical protein
MSDTEIATPKKPNAKKRKAKKVAKVVKTAKRAVVKRTKTSAASAVEKPFLTAIHRKEREIRKIRDMMGKAKDLAG